MSLVNEIISEQNLLWAWEKTLGYYQTMESCYDVSKIVEFEANLNEEIASIRRDVIEKKYKLLPIIPLPKPKKTKDKTQQIMRQYFDIAIRDQVLWIAIINIIGYRFEMKMPFWSYGNRLNMPIYRDEDNIWKYDWYRYGSYNTYNPWYKAWKKYQKSIKITLKKMTRQYNNAYDEDELELLDSNRYSLGHLKNNYFDDNYWESNSTGEVYWASLDFENFYPNINTAKLLEILCQEYEEDEYLCWLLKVGFDFKLDISQYSNEDIVDYKKIIIKDPLNYNALPTGLMVAGFLANVYLITIDNEISSELSEDHNVAIFRFVDDHIFLCTSFSKLEEWLNKYSAVVNTEGLGIKINKGKTKPEELVDYFLARKDKNKESKKVIAEKSCLIDKDFPKPFMTQTLDKIYMISNIEQEFCTLEESERNLADLLQLLSVEIPEEEIREDTKTSFVANQLSRHATIYLKNACRKRLALELEEILCKINQATIRKIEINRRIFDLQNECKKNIAEAQENNICGKIDQLNSEQLSLEKEIEQYRHEMNCLSKPIIEDIMFKPNKIEIHILKVIRENYDKVNLWKSYFSFIRKNGIEVSCDLIDQLEYIDHDKNNFSKLTTAYIYTYIMSCLIMEINNAIRIILNSTASIYDKRNNFQFILFALDNRIIELLLLNLKFDFQKEIASSYFSIIYSINSLYVVASDNFNNKVNYLGLGINDDDINNFRSKCDKILDAYQEKYYQLDIKKNTVNLIWKIIKENLYFFQSHPEYLKKWCKKCVKENEFEKMPSSLRAIFLTFPSILRKENSCKIVKKLGLNYNTGWVIDFIGTKREVEEGYCNLEDFLARFSDVIDSEYNSLIELISLHIVEKIIEELKRLHILGVLGGGIEFSGILNPYNILINGDSLYDILRETDKMDFINKFLSIQKYIEIKIETGENIICDTRYDIVGSFSDESRNEYYYSSIRNSIALIMIRMLLVEEKTITEFNIFMFNKSYIRNIIKLLSDVPLSSTTYTIIKEAISPMATERMIAVKLQRALIGDLQNNKKNKIVLDNLQDIQKAIQEAIKVLHNNLYIDAQSITQAIPVDLQQINSYENVYMEDGTDNE